MSQQPGWGQPQQGWGAPPAQQYPPQQQAPWGQQPAQQAPAQQPAWGQQGWGQQQPAAPAGPPAAPPGGDPFGGEKIPAVSWKDAPQGATIVMDVLGPAEIVQSRDFETNKLEFWEPEYPGAPPQPKWSVVTNGIVNGEKRALWAAKTSKEGSLCRAIADAQAAAGFKVDKGTRLTVQLVGEEPPPADRPRNSPRKLYRAKLEQGAPGGPGDAFAQPPAQQPTMQQAPPPEFAQQQQWGAPPAQPAPQGPPPGQWPAQQPPGYGPPQDAPPAPPAGPPADPWGQQQAPSGPPAGPPY